jgi:hypothetical protein
MSCHSVDYIAIQPPKKGQAFWEAEVTKTIKTYKAPNDEADIKAIGLPGEDLLECRRRRPAAPGRWHRIWRLSPTGQERLVVNHAFNCLFTTESTRETIRSGGASNEARE